MALTVQNAGLLNTTVDTLQQSTFIVYLNRILSCLFHSTRLSVYTNRSWENPFKFTLFCLH